LKFFADKPLFFFGSFVVMEEKYSNRYSWNT